ncbi:50S ribosomal protein L29, partial [Mesoplasma photuris]|uniref:50S ribosomal protein L29 n=1 Tax=Mesoplasma photuris TaxID=217731 RepID=UPI0004E0F702
MAKTNPIAELKTLSVEELIKTGESKRAELFALKFQASVGSLEQTHKIKEIKKQIARIELVLSEKRLAGENTNQTIKGDYSKAVAEAESAGKEVRAKQRKMIEKMQAEQFGTSVDEDAIAAAMANAVTEQEGDAE